MDYFVLFSLFGDDVRSLGLNVWRANVEAWGLWLVDLIPWMLADLINVDSFVGVCVEYLCNHIFCLFRKKIRKIVFCI